MFFRPETPDDSIVILDKRGSDTFKHFGVVENNPVADNTINLQVTYLKQTFTLKICSTSQPLENAVQIGDMQLLCNTTKRTFTELKDKRDYSDTAKVLNLSENDIIIHGFNNIAITNSKDKLKQWQIEDGLMISKFVKRVT